MKTNTVFLKRPLTDAAKLTRILVVLLAAVSLAGLFFPTVLYPTAELMQSYLTNDIINLILGMPVLVGSMWFARRGSLLGLLLWPGALLYVVYNYLAYTFGNPLGWLVFISAALVLISSLTIINLIGCIDSENIREQIGEYVPKRFSGGVMIVFGVFFILRTAGMIAGTIQEQESLPITEIGLAVADVTLSILFIAGGVLLLRSKASGFVMGLGLLFSASTLFIGLLIFFILEPFVRDVKFPFVDFVVVAVMGLVCFIPFGLYVRAIWSSNSK